MSFETLKETFEFESSIQNFFAIIVFVECIFTDLTYEVSTVHARVNLMVFFELSHNIKL